MHNGVAQPFLHGTNASKQLSHTVCSPNHHRPGRCPIISCQPASGACETRPIHVHACILGMPCRRSSLSRRSTQSSILVLRQCRLTFVLSARALAARRHLDQHYDFACIAWPLCLRVFVRGGYLWPPRQFTGCSKMEANAQADILKQSCRRVVQRGWPREKCDGGDSLRGFSPWEPEPGSWEPEPKRSGPRFGPFGSDKFVSAAHYRNN